MPKDQYILEIYEPLSARDPLITFNSDRPFMAMQPGDLLNARTWEYNGGYSLLKITGLEHLLWSIDKEVTHKILVYTEEVEDSRKSRPNP